MFLVITILNILYRPILTLKEVVLDLSKGNGDLTRRLPVTSDDDLGQISEGINVFIQNLQTLMLEVSQSSEHISTSVDQLKNQTEANSNVLKDHTKETVQIVAAVEEMSATANDVAQNASEASQSTDNTNSQVISSKSVVTSATTTVSQLVEDVENTSTSIAEIEQTLNKLLNGSNAAISAMNSTKSTCERTVENTSMVANDLDAIAHSVVHINDLNMQIATAAEQQSTVADEITRNMTSIHEIVGELSANGEATTNETINLAGRC
ncbi:methyl-accepting chemotaxis protein [Photobacterium sagamiensis]|uniref:methyl-accepting chemotaxis protein n=1 Tax=Photobacterium sagamiensis TaxID=2910241 RepID=UPI003D115E8A